LRLRRSHPDRAGIARRRCGSGFSYLDAEGKVSTDREVVERPRTLAVPPAWRGVWICTYPNGNIQAVGTDEAGRRQYLYHDEWRIAQDADKYDQVRRLARLLQDFRTSPRYRTTWATPRRWRGTPTWTRG
jgi:DNA topoisomerase I